MLQMIDAVNACGLAAKRINGFPPEGDHGR
jgi:hypothetical protein